MGACDRVAIPVSQVRLTSGLDISIAGMTCIYRPRAVGVQRPTLELHISCTRKAADTYLDTASISPEGFLQAVGTNDVPRGGHSAK